MIESIEITKGYVYILINTSYPGLLKIGKSKRSPEIRASELSMSTGVPNSFHVAYYLIVSDIDTAELQIHKSLKEYREVRNREFFRLPLNQAIDLMKKILQDNNIDFANHEEETYKFKYEEYNSTKDFFNDILNDEDKWEHAKLHLEKDYLVPWLKKKGEVDALINLEMRSDNKDFKNLDYQLSLISYSIIDSKFKLFSTEIIKVEDVVSLFYSTSIDRATFEKAWITDVIYFRYKGFLDSMNKDSTRLFKVIKFIKNNKNNLSIYKLETIKKIITWSVKPGDFKEIETLDSTTIKYLISHEEFKERTKLLPFPEEVLTSMIFTSDRANTIAIIDFIQAYEESVTEIGFNLKGNKDLKLFLIDNKFIPHIGYINKLLSLPKDEFLFAIKNLTMFKELNYLNDNELIPKDLFLILTSTNNFNEFILASAAYTFLKEGFKLMKWNSNINKDFTLYKRFEIMTPTILGCFITENKEKDLSNEFKGSNHNFLYKLCNLKIYNIMSSYNLEEYGLIEVLNKIIVRY